MGRPERPLDTIGDPVAAFAHDLRELRRRAGNPSYRELARSALFAPYVLSNAASGHRLPTLPVTLAFVNSCGGDRAAWERRWRMVAGGTATQSRGGRMPGTPPPCAPAPAQIQADAPRPRPCAQPGTALTRPAQLPLGAATFIGRGHELSRASGTARLTGRVKIPLMISGPTGIGKTAFALRLADELMAEFPDGHLYADLGTGYPGNPSPDSVMTGFLRALGVPAPLVPVERCQRIGLYRSLLAERRLFVLLENAYDESQVRPLLAQSPHTQFVITSSARLLGLDCVQRIDLPALARPESVTLLGRLAGLDRIRAEDASADAIAEVCGDLPLALNIIGRKLAARPEWTVGYVASLLADRGRLMDFLGVGDVTVRDRYAAAYRLLPAACRRAVRHLGGQHGQWVTAPGLATAMGAPVDAAEYVLESLVDTGLITRSDAAGRYGISTLVSAYAATTQLDVQDLTFMLPSVVSPSEARRGAAALAPAWPHAVT